MGYFVIENGTVHDPTNGIDGQRQTIWIKDGKIVDRPAESNPVIDRRIDAGGYVVMPGGIDMHCHIAGPKVNVARKMRPEEKRKALVKAYSGRDDAAYQRYPRLILAEPRHHPQEQTTSQPVCEEVASEEAWHVQLQFGQTELNGLSSLLGERLAHGGCAAVICNTVARAIEIYKHLREVEVKSEELLSFNKMNEVFLKQFVAFLDPIFRRIECWIFLPHF